MFCYCERCMVSRDICTPLDGTQHKMTPRYMEEVNSFFTEQPPSFFEKLFTLHVPVLFSYFHMCYPLPSYQRNIFIIVPSY